MEKKKGSPRSNSIEEIEGTTQLKNRATQTVPFFIYSDKVNIFFRMTSITKTRIILSGEGYITVEIITPAKITKEREKNTSKMKDNGS